VKQLRAARHRARAKLQPGASMFPPFFAIAVAIMTRSLVKPRGQPPSSKTEPQPPPVPHAPLRLVWSQDDGAPARPIPARAQS
jgi:hypothetical protein